MDENSKQLLKEFCNISNKGWIESINSKAVGTVGLTFEHELNKKADSMYFPDYCGIELKCSTRFSNWPLYLFGIAFDGPSFPEIDRIIEKFGWYDKDFPDKKILYSTLNCSYKKTILNGYKLQFKVDRKQEKLFLLVYDGYDNLIDDESYIYFSSIKSHLELKLSKLAYVQASKRIINDKVYFRYYKISFYDLIGFDTFINLLEAGIVNAEIICRIVKSGTSAGKYKNKNIIFNIEKENMTQLFKCIYSCDTDEKVKKYKSNFF